MRVDTTIGVVVIGRRGLVSIDFILAAAMATYFRNGVSLTHGHTVISCAETL
jgi:hypothetical protein